MIFGFNTDIKHENTVYHVQSEAREHDRLLQTQVFVRGRCIGKHATSYADKLADPNFSDEHMHDLLKTQHKSVIDTIRAGGIDTLFTNVGDTTQPDLRRAAEPAVALVPPEQSSLTLEWVNSDAVYSADSMLMRFSLRQNGAAVPGAQLISRLTIASDKPIYSQAITDDDGLAEMKIFLQESTLSEAAVLVQATYAGQHATRKFRLRRTS